MFCLLVISVCSINAAEQGVVESEIMNQYLQWHNDILGSKLKAIDFEDVQRFIAQDAVLIVNDKIVAKNAQ